MLRNIEIRTRKKICLSGVQEVVLIVKLSENKGHFVLVRNGRFPSTDKNVYKVIRDF